MSEVTTYVTGKIPIFSGDKNDWAQWSEVFLSRSIPRGYNDILLREVEVPKTNQEKLSDEEAKIQERNVLAYGNLIAAMDPKSEKAKVAFNIIKSTKTEKEGDYKYGHAGKAWELLEEKYNPKTSPSLSSVIREFYGAKLKKDMDPDIWLTELEELRKKMTDMKLPINDIQFMVQVLESLPQEYEATALLLEKDLNKNLLTINEMKKELKLKFERMEKASDVEEEKGETALYAGSNGKRCNQCGKIGHIAQNCRQGNSR